MSEPATNPARTARSPGDRVSRTIPVSEDDLKGLVIDALHHHRWLVHHDRPARTNQGWKTAIEGDKGFPDIVAVHPRTGITMFLELKSAKGRLTEEQTEWLDRLVIANHELRAHDWSQDPFCDLLVQRRVVGVVRPKDRDEFLGWLFKLGGMQTIVGRLRP